MPTHDNYLSTCLSILMSCHVTCDIRPSASLRVPNEAERSGDEATNIHTITKPIVMYSPYSARSCVQNTPWLQIVYKIAKTLISAWALDDQYELACNKMRPYSSTMMCQYWDNRLIY